MSNFRISGLCHCHECHWNNETEQWEGRTQPATDTRTLRWMLLRPIECAKCHQLLTATAVCTPVSGTIPKTSAALPKAFVEEHQRKEATPDA